MQIQNKFNQTAFGSVTPIIAKKGGIKMLEKSIGKQKGNFHLQNATHLYIGNPKTGLLGQAVAQGKEVGFLVTGPEYEKAMFMEHGWSSETAPSRHIDRAILNIGEKFNSATTKLITRINSGK